jgi:hypothetical protein
MDGSALILATFSKSSMRELKNLSQTVKLLMSQDNCIAYVHIAVSIALGHLVFTCIIIFLANLGGL